MAKLIPRTQLADAGVPVSDSEERRRAASDPDWIPHVMIGRRRYYSSDAISCWIDAHQRTAEATGVAMPTC